MPKLYQILPELAEELSRAVAFAGLTKLAESVYALEIVERCNCKEPGCVTFYAVPKLAAPSPDNCKRIVAPTKSIACIQYLDQQIIWVEVHGRPEDREALDKLECDTANLAG